MPPPSTHLAKSNTGQPVTATRRAGIYQGRKEVEAKGRPWPKMGGRGHVLKPKADLRVRRGARVQKHGERDDAEGILLQFGEEPERGHLK
ncbi:MAG: hypothetical protein ACUVQM_06280, partial [Candidatus Hadarchaeaceae archaeon]